MSRFSADFEIFLRSNGPQFMKELRGVEKEMQRLEKRSSDVKEKGSSMFSSFLGASIVQDALGSVASAIGNIGSEMIQGNAQMESYRTAFNTMLGSMDKANALMSEVQKFGAETPYEFPELANSTKMLLAFGIGQEEVVGKLRKIGDIASGVGTPMNELAEIFGKAKVAGTLFGEDINQLVGRGVPIIQEFAKQLGVSESQVKKLASEGKITFDMLDTAFTNLTSNGGQFSGMMEAQSKTFEGTMSTFNDNIGQMVRDFGAPFFDEAKKGLIKVMDYMSSPEMTNSLKNLSKMFDTIFGLFDSEGESMIRHANNQNKLIQTQVNYNNTRIEELEAIEPLKDEYENLASKSKLSADEQKRLKELGEKANAIYPGLITNTDNYKSALDRLKEGANKASTDINNLNQSNLALGKAMAQNAVNIAIGEKKNIEATLRQISSSLGGIAKLGEADELGKLIRQMMTDERRFAEYQQKTNDMLAKNANDPAIEHRQQIENLIVAWRLSNQTIREAKDNLNNYGKEQQKTTETTTTNTTVTNTNTEAQQKHRKEIEKLNDTMQEHYQKSSDWLRKWILEDIESYETRYKEANEAQKAIFKLLNEKPSSPPKTSQQSQWADDEEKLAEEWRKEEEAWKKHYESIEAIASNGMLSVAGSIGGMFNVKDTEDSGRQLLRSVGNILLEMAQMWILTLAPLTAAKAVQTFGVSLITDAPWVAAAYAGLELLKGYVNSFDVGTARVPKDQIAKIHKNELIVPDTFAEAIRSGQLVLGGPGSMSNQRSNVVDIHVSRFRNAIQYADNSVERMRI